MIWNVDYFPRSATSVACIIPYELEKREKNLHVFWVDDVNVDNVKMKQYMCLV